ncbi:hypothetical protein BpHYR1_050440 [Brachionus plicatilis]|uniref:Uncharacterized protein n=1 Tax=Brachionus plicatilis TaxID=10195 RepID=A0A3M7R8B1_BRAPC|nr:hypothetical protein BpHYR1_050440 [Brachionus plicatilis]
MDRVIDLFTFIITAVDHLDQVDQVVEPTKRDRPTKRKASIELSNNEENQMWLSTKGQQNLQEKLQKKIMEILQITENAVCLGLQTK